MLLFAVCLAFWPVSFRCRFTALVSGATTRASPRMSISESMKFCSPPAALQSVYSLISVKEMAWFNRKGERLVWICGSGRAFRARKRSDCKIKIFEFTKRGQDRLINIERLCTAKFAGRARFRLASFAVALYFHVLSPRST